MNKENLSFKRGRFIIQRTKNKDGSYDVGVIDSISKNYIYYELEISEKQSNISFFYLNNSKNLERELRYTEREFPDELNPFFKNKTQLSLFK